MLRLARREDSRLDQGEREGLLQFWNLRDCVFENIYMYTIMLLFINLILLEYTCTCTPASVLKAGHVEHLPQCIYIFFIICGFQSLSLFFN